MTFWNVLSILKSLNKTENRMQSIKSEFLRRNFHRYHTTTSWISSCYTGNARKTNRRTKFRDRVFTSLSAENRIVADTGYPYRRHAWRT